MEGDRYVRKNEDNQGRKIPYLEKRIARERIRQRYQQHIPIRLLPHSEGDGVGVLVALCGGDAHEPFAGRVWLAYGV